MAIIGLPTTVGVTTWCIRTCRQFTRQLNILMSAQKAQMRSELLVQYKSYMAAGWIDTDDMTEWENQYQAYHELVGNNGVLDEKRKKLLKLPDTPPTPTIEIGE